MRAAVLVLAAAASSAYRWPQQQTYHSEKLSFSEFYQYATNEGPWPFWRGESYVLADVRAKLGTPGRAANLSVVAFTAREVLALKDINLCYGRDLVADSPRRKHKVFQVSGDHFTRVKLKFKVEISGT